MTTTPHRTAPVERFRVSPGGVTALKVFGGDRFDVIDPYGRQPAELTVLSDDPRAVPGSAPDTAATVLRRLVAGPDEDGYAATRLLDLLSRHGFDQRTVAATRLFDDVSPAGARTGFVVDADAVVLIAAPAASMSPLSDDPNPPSEVWVEIRRADVRLPEPRSLAVQWVRRIGLSVSRPLPCVPG